MKRTILLSAIMLLNVIYINTIAQINIKANYTETTAGLNMEMIYVQGGSFMMGSNESDAEKPIHSVSVNDYYMCKTEVTQAQWYAIMGTNPSYNSGCDNCPVDVSWEDAQEFIQKLNQKTGKQYRLPTEAEWEYAARGGNKSKGYKYAGSNNIEKVAWYDGNSNGQTHAVATKQPNELGIYDMSGNVFEWCSDWYKGYSDSSRVSDYEIILRVYRGGSWEDRRCRSTYRDNTLHPRSSALGFRLVSSK